MGHLEVSDVPWKFTISFLMFSVINPCLEPAIVNGTSVLRDSGVCGAHGTCEALSAGNYGCKCDKDYTGNHCHTSKMVMILTHNLLPLGNGFIPRLGLSHLH